MSTRITFGKHKGQALEDIPIEYLKWLDEQSWLKEDFRKDVEFEIERRTSERSSIGKIVSNGPANLLRIPQNDFTFELNEAEKEELHKALVGQSVCPASYTFDASKISTDLLLKLKGVK